MTRPHFARPLIVATFLLVAAASSAARADCVEELTHYTTSVRVQENGQWVNKDIDILFPDDGAGEWYKVLDGGQPCLTPKKNCNDDSFEHFIIDVDTGWQVTILGVTYDVDDVERYWDWYYSAPTYAKISGVDFTTNHHGYAFPEGGGTHPLDGQFGTEIILHANANPVPCYAEAYTHDADVVLTPGHLHSMRVEGFYPCTNPYTAWEIFTKTSEKSRESGVYEQLGICGDNPSEHSADPLKAHAWASGYEKWRRL